MVKSRSVLLEEIIACCSCRSSYASVPISSSLLPILEKVHTHTHSHSLSEVCVCVCSCALVLHRVKARAKMPPEPDSASLQTSTQIHTNRKQGRVQTHTHKSSRLLEGASDAEGGRRITAQHANQWREKKKYRDAGGNKEAG